MCGIVGAYGPAAQSLTSTHLLAALHAIAHRGPDGEGLCAGAGREVAGYATPETPAALGLPPAPRMDATDRRVVLGHRRLSIIDLSIRGHQPMRSPDGRFWLSFNGEIYNYRELRDELQREGRQFTTDSDSEVLLQALSTWGNDAFARCEGMFAAAVYDTADDTLLLTRDRFGIKPLYFSRRDGGCLFASQQDALRRLEPARAAVLDTEVAAAFLALGLSDTGTGTFVTGVEEVPAGSVMRFDRAGFSSRDWRPRLPVALEAGDPAPRRALVRDRLMRSVELHLRSDVPLGLCLSGGLDSSLLLALVREVQGSAAPIRTFSFITPESAESEEPFIDLVARRFGTEAHKCRVDFAELLAPQGSLRSLLRRMDLPVLSTSVVAQHWVYRLAREHGVTVVLDGQGSDELFAGYSNYASVQLAAHLRSGRFGAAVSLAGALMRGGEVRRAASAIPLILPLPLRRGLLRARLQTARAPWIRDHALLEPGLDAMLGTHLPDLREALSNARRVTPLPALLRFADRNSMLASVESRVPFLSGLVEDACATLPPGDLIASDGTRKAVLRDIARGMLPDAVIDRPKVGFSAPRASWVPPLLEWEPVAISFAREEGYALLDAGALPRVFDAARAGDAHSQDAAWRVVNLAAWARECGITTRAGHSND
jgi:asparagine synthase (glutamine-hydrolysing)